MVTDCTETFPRFAISTIEQSGVKVDSATLVGEHAPEIVSLKYCFTCELLFI